MEKRMIGYRFIPTEVETLRILRWKAESEKGESVHPNVIERDMYGDDGDKATPWKIFTEANPWETMNDPDSTDSKKEIKFLYVITKLIKLSDSRTQRVAGCGTWVGHTGKSYIKLKGKKIGFKKMFKFKAKNGSISSGNWIMHEYHLDGEFLEGIVSSDYVICRIRRDDSRTSPQRALRVDFSTESEALKVQEDNRSVQDSAKRQYKSSFLEEETQRQTKVFKHQTISTNIFHDATETICTQQSFRMQNLISDDGFDQRVQMDAKIHELDDFGEFNDQQLNEILNHPTIKGILNEESL